MNTKIQKTIWLNVQTLKQIEELATKISPQMTKNLDSKQHDSIEKNDYFDPGTIGSEYRNLILI